MREIVGTKRCQHNTHAIINIIAVVVTLGILVSIGIVISFFATYMVEEKGSTSFERYQEIKKGLEELEIGQNSPPVANPDVYDAYEDMILHRNADDGVLSNDVDDDGPLGLSALLDTDASNGVLALEEDGSFTYTPNEQWYGVDTFSYFANDGSDDSDIVVVQIDVHSVNDKPVVFGIPDQNIPKGGVFASINLDDYVTDIEDLDEDIVWSNSDIGVDLIVEIVDRVATISVGNPEWVGIAEITFTGRDSGGLYDSDEATFTVTAVENIAPVAVEDEFVTVRRSPLNIDAEEGVLANDIDEDGPEELITELVDNNIVHGEFEFFEDGSLYYMAEIGWIGEETFTYHAYDGEDYSETVTVTIDVVPFPIASPFDP